MGKVNKEKIIEYCKNYIHSFSVEHYEKCDNNLRVLQSDNIVLDKLEGCPQNYGLEDAEELCSAAEDYSCSECWENALKKKKNSSETRVYEVCSRCGKRDITVDKNMFDGMCADCIDKVL